MAIAVSHVLQPQDDPRGPRKFNHPPGGKTARGNASHVSQPATGPKSAKRNPLVHAQSANKKVIESGIVLSPEEEGGLPLPRQHAGRLRQPRDSDGSPQRDVYLHRGAPGGP